MAVEKRADVTWRGDLMSGNGTIERVGSAAFGPLGVSWAARTGEGQDELTSPEELIAAAHAACFSMALSNGLAKAGTRPESLSVSATVTFVPGTGITASVLEVEGRVPGVVTTHSAIGQFTDEAITARPAGRSRSARRCP